MKKFITAFLFLAIFSFLMTYGNVAKAKKIELEADVVVIGGGGSGLAAAVSAAEGGADVIVLEKMPVMGGSSNFPEGIFGVASSIQQKANIKTTRDQVFKEHMEKNYWSANARLARAIIDKSGSTIDWLQETGVKFKHPQVFLKGATIRFTHSQATVHP
jgi:fumarate reductase flavoprotein subunit